MITKDLLENDGQLNGLTDEQKDAIITLSKNDEEAAFARRFSEVYNQMDATIAEATGIARNGDEKTYLYLKRATNELAAKANSVDGLNERIATLTKERDSYKKTIENGVADEQMKKALEKATADLNDVRGKFAKLEDENKRLVADHAREIIGFRVENDLASALGKVALRSDLPKSAVDALIKQTFDEIKAIPTEIQKDDATGVETLVFVGKNGETLRDESNKLAPETAESLLMKRLKALGVIDEGRRQQGAGTTPPAREGSSDPTIDISMARTQNEADDIIARTLMQRGFTTGSRQFSTERNKAWKENYDFIKTLPTR